MGSDTWVYSETEGTTKSHSSQGKTEWKLKRGLSSSLLGDTEKIPVPDTHMQYCR